MVRGQPAGSERGPVQRRSVADPIWQAAAQVDAAGWTAEVRIPLLLRFSREAVQTWGSRSGATSTRPERADYVVVPVEAIARRAGVLRPPLRPGNLEAAEGTGRCLRGHGQHVLKRARAGDPNHDGGARRLRGRHLEYLLTSNLTLDATFNLMRPGRSGFLGAESERVRDLLRRENCRSSSQVRARSVSGACVAPSAATAPALSAFSSAIRWPQRPLLPR